MANMSPAWKTCSNLYAEAPDSDGRWSASTRARSSSSAGAPADPGRAGQLERYDYEYRRNGTVNLFVCRRRPSALAQVKVTERRAAEDYAHCMRELVDVHYPEATCIPGGAG